MTRLYSHRKSSFGTQNKARPMESMYAAGCSVLSIIAYIVLILVDAFMAGETPNIVGGVSFLFFCVAVSSFVYILSQMKKKTELKDRVICLSISAVAFLVWVVTFILGMLN